MNDLPDRIIAVFLPERCVFCDNLVEYDDYWCEKCGEDFKRYGNIESGALAATEYSGDIRTAVWKLKDRGDKRAAKFFAGEMHAAITKAWSGISFGLIIPVPATKSKLDERGYNQAGLLARALGRMMGIPVCADALIRREDTQVQHGLSAAQREANAGKSYDAGNDGQAAGKTVLLVDDVYTTGSTARVCSHKLLEAGAAAVYVATAAYQVYRGESEE